MSSRKPNVNLVDYGTGGISNTYDPYKILEKVNNYKKAQIPNFKLMTSRPDTGDPNLPTYMKVKILL